MSSPRELANIVEFLYLFSILFIFPASFLANVTEKFNSTHMFNIKYGEKHSYL